MNIQNLKPFDIYLISLDRLYDSYNKTKTEYEESKWEIDWCGGNYQLKLQNIQNFYDSLKSTFSNFKKAYRITFNVYSTLTEHEKQIFNQNKFIYKKVQNLLKEVGLYLKNNNIHQI